MNLRLDIQRLRNLTTERLHTTFADISEDLETISGTPGLFTHMLPRMNTAVMPWLREQVTDPRVWDGQYDPTHTGTVTIPMPSAAERAAMMERYRALPNPLFS